MSGFGIIMLIFGICVLLVGLYMYTGHKLRAIAWRAPYRKLTINEWKIIGKWNIISSMIIFLIAILAFVFKI